MKIGHLIVGALGLVAFVLTGQYMQWHFNHLVGMADGPRLMYRSAHIYILWASLLNLALGCYLEPFAARLPKRLQQVGSAAILIGPVLTCVSFFAESQNPVLWRGWSRAGIYLALAGVALHGLAAALDKADASRS